jgi:phage replication-related protein YjqB (UPF0714/DUF867 family)
MDPSFKSYFDRRQFLLALGAGVPLLAHGCGDLESLDLRESETEDFREGEFDPDPALVTELTSSIQVVGALTSQTFTADEQGCSIPKVLGVEVGDQIRVFRNSEEYALYTVAEKRKKDDPNRVRMGLDARLRLGTSSEFSATLAIPAVAQDLTDAEAELASEFVERLVDDGVNKGLVVCAPHGGTIETRTDLQAEAVTEALGCSSWICKGWRQGGGSYERWHITSTKISRNSFPGLDLIADRDFAHAISFHGMASGGVLIGGAAPFDLREKVRAAIATELSNTSVSVTLAVEDDEFNGDSAYNFVNWLTQGGAGGVQIEQGLKVRIDHWQRVADGVIKAFM